MNEISGPRACRLRRSKWSLLTSTIPVRAVCRTSGDPGADAGRPVGDPGGRLNSLVAICLPLSMLDAWADQGSTSAARRRGTDLGVQVRLPRGRHRVAQLTARGDAELGEDLAQMPFHRADAEEQLGADLRVGVAFDREPGDVRLLRRERADRLDRARAYCLAGGHQLVPRAFGERIHAHRGQRVVGGPQLGAGVCAALFAAQPFAVEQVRAGEFGPQLGAAEPVDRLAVQSLGRLALAQQRTRARLYAEAEVGSSGSSRVGQPF